MVIKAQEPFLYEPLQLLVKKKNELYFAVFLNTVITTEKVLYTGFSCVSHRCHIPTLNFKIPLRDLPLG